MISLFFFFFLKGFAYGCFACVDVWVPYACAGPSRGRKRVLYLPRLQLQKVVSHLVSAGKNQACALSCGTISPAPRHISFDITDKVHNLSSICSIKSDEFGRCYQVTDEWKNSSLNLFFFHCCSAGNTKIIRYQKQPRDKTSERNSVPVLT